MIDALEIVTEYDQLTKDIAAMETRKDELKPMLAELRGNRDKLAIPFTINGAPFEYIISKIVQDKRKLDEDKLGEFLISNSETAYAVKYKPVPDGEIVSALMKAKTITKEDIESCMVGKIITYSLVTRREVKDDEP